MIVSNRVSLSVPKSSFKGVDLKQFSYALNHISFDITSFLSHLVEKSTHKFLGLHQNGSIYLTSLFEIFFGILIERKCPHGEPDYFIATLI